jgi:hypothetical protein
MIQPENFRCVANGIAEHTLLTLLHYLCKLAVVESPTFRYELATTKMKKERKANLKDYLCKRMRKESAIMSFIAYIVNSQ